MRCRFFKHCISAQLLIIVVIIITLFVEMDSCGGCVELFPTHVIQTFPIKLTENEYYASIYFCLCLAFKRIYYHLTLKTVFSPFPETRESHTCFNGGV